MQNEVGLGLVPTTGWYPRAARMSRVSSYCAEHISVRDDELDDALMTEDHKSLRHQKNSLQFHISFRGRFAWQRPQVFMVQQWHIQWRACTNHSDTTKVFECNGSVLPLFEKHDSDSSQSSNQRHRSQPRLQCLDTSLDRSSSTAGTPGNTAHDFWGRLYLPSLNSGEHF